MESRALKGRLNEEELERGTHTNHPTERHILWHQGIRTGDIHVRPVSSPFLFFAGFLAFTDTITYQCINFDNIQFIILRAAAYVQPVLMKYPIQ